jgi:hypothetical protein
MIELAPQQRIWWDHVSHRRKGVPEGVLASPARMALVVEMTWTRLVEALRTLFPLTADACGDETFRSLAVTYLGQHPSRHHDIDHIGDNWPEFLAQSSVAQTGSWASLACFERAKNRAFSAPNDEGAASLASFPGEEVMRTQLSWSAAATIVTMCCDSAMRIGLPSESCLVGVYRVGHVVHWRRMNHVDRLWRDVLARGTHDFVEGCTEVATAGCSADDVGRSLRRLCEEGVVVVRRAEES